jgi:ribosomal protein S27E
VTTASVTGSPRYFSAICFICSSTIAEISGGE